MKKLLIVLTAVVALFSMASAEPVGIRSINWHPQTREGSVKPLSVATNVTSSSVGVLWLRDGLSTNYTAVSYPLFQVSGLSNRVEIVALGAFDSNFSKTNVWGGTGLSVSVLRQSGFELKVYGGYKGFNFGNNFKLAEGAEAFVWGVGLNIPIR